MIVSIWNRRIFGNFWSPTVHLWDMGGLGIPCTLAAVKRRNGHLNKFNNCGIRILSLWERLRSHFKVQSLTRLAKKGFLSTQLYKSINSSTKEFLNKSRTLLSDSFAVLPTTQQTLAKAYRIVKSNSNCQALAGRLFRWFPSSWANVKEMELITRKEHYIKPNE